jgi:hypothetical protein
MLIVLIILVLLCVGGFPAFGYNRSWGYGPSGIIGLILVIVVIYILVGGGGLHLGRF